MCIAASVKLLLKFNLVKHMALENWLLANALCFTKKHLEI